MSPAGLTAQTNSPPKNAKDVSGSKEPMSPPPDAMDAWPESPMTPGMTSHPVTLSRTTSKDYEINMSNAVQKSTDSEQGTSGGSGGSEGKVRGKTQDIHDIHDMPEFPFITINRFPPGFLIHLGGLVSSKSIKVI